jgi:subtilase family serine protease
MLTSSMAGHNMTVWTPVEMARVSTPNSNEWRRSKSMKRTIELMVVAAAVLLFGFATSLPAQKSGPGSPIVVSEGSKPSPVHYPSAPGTLVIPESSKLQTVPAGHYFAAHTNVELFIPAGLPESSSTPTGVPYSGYGYETPESLACVYGLVTEPSGASPNCNPNNSALGAPSGGSKTIAIVDAYDDPDAEGDSLLFSYQFGLPMVPPTVVYAVTGNNSAYCPGYVQVDYSGGWEIEESVDIEWAHAMAPSATIYLVEACTNFDQDLQQAVLVANNLVNCGKTGITGSGVNTSVCGTTANPGEVSMSWGGGEFYGETGTACTSANGLLNDGCFTAANVVYFASSGDSPGVIWPGTSPNVVSSGGTTNRRDASTFNWIQETAWVFAGGGVSYVEPKPSYQLPIGNLSFTTYRGVPDLSFDADPITGVWVYDTFPMYGYVYQWWILGGTSVSAPSLAGVINTAGSFAASSNAELTVMYNNRKVAADFTDIPAGAGYCGFYMGTSTLQYYDLCTGLGVPNTYAGK